LEKPPKSSKPSLLQNHHCKTSISTKLIIVKHTQNSLSLIKSTALMNEDQSLIKSIKILAWNPINTPYKIKAEGGERRKEGERGLNNIEKETLNVKV
jgi:hypothetical protein